MSVKVTGCLEVRSNADIVNALEVLGINWFSMKDVNNDTLITVSDHQDIQQLSRVIGSNETEVSHSRGR